jgi:hypothetical protein
MDKEPTDLERYGHWQDPVIFILGLALFVVVMKIMGY